MKKKKYSVGLLGATGAVGQRFLLELADHPWFRITRLMASERSTGKKYAAVVNWFLDDDIPHCFRSMMLHPCTPDQNLDLVFSGLDAKVAWSIESEFASAGIPVVSNTKSHRLDEYVPLIIPEVNPHHVEMIPVQRKRLQRNGFIATNPNCSTIVLSLALAPLQFEFGLKRVIVTTLQAVSGAGYPGVSSNDIIDNVIPYIPGEEGKLETEPLKIFGNPGGESQFADIKLSAQCNRVMVRDGHLVCVSVELKKKVESEAIKKAWENFVPAVSELKLPSAVEKPLFYCDEPDRPQPRKDRLRGKGMTVSIGRLAPCNVLDYKFIALGHNTIRGAAGGAILLAELLAEKGFFDPIVI